MRQRNSNNNYSNQQSRIPDSHHLALSKDVYRNNLHKGDVAPNGYKISRIDRNNETGFKGALYERTINGKTNRIYATAGTQDLKDAVEDARQLVGHSEQYRESVLIAKDLVMDYPNVEFTGHSLGGGEANANALSTGNRAVTFNPAAISQPTKDNLGLTGRTADITSYVVKGEAVNHYQSTVLGLHAEGTIKTLPASYVPRIPFTPIDDLIRTYQRVDNHSLDTVIEKFNQ